MHTTSSRLGTASLGRDDGGQLRLDESTEDHDRRLARDWQDFFERQIDDLTRSDEFVRSILTAAAFGNTEEGYAAEDDVGEYLKERYAEMYRPRVSATRPEESATRSV
jgi:hypothetical protein